jgi:alpha-L-fucosidase
MKTCCSSTLALLLLGGLLSAAQPPAPYGPVPSPRQLAWHQVERYAFIHFTVNTFTDREWGNGDEAEKVFNPTDFDADQIVGTIKDAGLRGVVLTCKHHDGFCLWPSKYTEHSVKNSPWKDGKGDVVKEISEACRRHGLKFGVYLSPWDRNHKDYARPEYITYYRNQLRELLGNYGPIFELWFDGANGGDGYYGGARERRNIDNRVYYDWENTWKIVRQLQPLACMFSDGGPDVRWIGNESGFAGETCWATVNRAGTFPGHADSHILVQGQRDGHDWLPGEVDVSIRPGWFYHAREDKQVRSPANLLKIYYESVGRGANLILNLPPDRRGRIHENDVKSLLAWHKLLDATFAKDLAQGAKATASNTRGNDEKFAAACAIDGNPETYWASDDRVTTPELVLDLGKPVTFNVARVREYLPLGQRIDAIAVETWGGSQWQPFATATSVGNQRLLRGKNVTTSKVRLRVTKAAACPAISEFGLFLSPE